MREAAKGERGSRKAPHATANLNVQASYGLVAAHVHTYIVAAHVCVCVCVDVDVCFATCASASLSMSTLADTLKLTLGTCSLPKE